MTGKRRAGHDTAAPGLHFIGADAGELCREPRLASWLVERHAWLVEQRLGRIAAEWPESIDRSWLEAHGMAVLRRAVIAADTVDDLQTLGPKMVEERLRQLLAGTAWYREAMLERARPLCEAWREAMAGGHEPSDRILCSKLHLSPDDLTEAFIEFATVFAVEPAVLLPRQSEEGWRFHEIMQQLPADQQLVCSLYYDEELTLGEIAGAMGQEQKRVQELLGRAAVVLAVRCSQGRNAGGWAP